LHLGYRQFPSDEAGQPALRDQFHSGAKRLTLTCPFPNVVEKVRKATAAKDTPRDPKVALLEIRVPGVMAVMSYWVCVQ
jgi:hypothetical protein